MKLTRASLIISGLTSICLLSALIGYRLGSDAKASKTKEQIQCLKAMWGEPLSLVQHQRVQALQDDPEAVRSYFLDLLQEDNWTSPGGFITNAVKLKVGEGIDDLSRANQMKPRAVLLLQQWQSGQTDIRNTPMPHGHLGGKAPLWDLYLSNPHEAWRRGADDMGAGGK